MATQLFLLDTVSDTHLGADNANDRATPANVGWTSRALGTARGSGVVASDAVATITSSGFNDEVTVTKGSAAVEWISPPVAADVTLSGTITGNIWGSESNMSANVLIAVMVEIIRANATATRNSNSLVHVAGESVTKFFGAAAELAVTTRAANNFTVAAYTPQTLNRGDRLRIRLMGAPSGTMAATYTFNASWNGASAAADGDSYVTFTENITFESAPGTVVQSDSSGNGTYGRVTGTQQVAQPFTALGNLTQVSAWLGKGGSPTDNVILEIQTDSGGSPSGSVVGTVATIAGTSIPTSYAKQTSAVSITLTPSTTYWLVIRRSGSLSDTDSYTYGRSAGAAPAGWTGGKFYTGSWSALAQALAVELTFDSTSVLYLTDTASAVSTASVDREAWTSRGAGVQTDVRNTATGWTAPLQLTDTAGGTVVDWFTRPLTAFTLTGMAVANLRAAASSASGNDSLRCEIARVEGDGTSPTVWASWCIAPITTDNGELGTSEAARTCNVSGDDLAITDGQRLRIRLYTDDMSSAAMASGFTTTVYYAGTSGGASGDTYVTFPQTLTEYSSGPYTYTKAGYGKEAG